MLPLCPGTSDGALSAALGDKLPAVGVAADSRSDQDVSNLSSGPGGLNHKVEGRPVVAELLETPKDVALGVDSGSEVAAERLCCRGEVSSAARL